MKPVPNAEQVTEAVKALYVTEATVWNLMEVALRPPPEGVRCVLRVPELPLVTGYKPCPACDGTGRCFMFGEMPNGNLQDRLGTCPDCDGCGSIGVCERCWEDEPACVCFTQALRYVVGILKGGVWTDTHGQSVRPVAWALVADDA